MLDLLGADPVLLWVVLLAFVILQERSPDTHGRHDEIIKFLRQTCSYAYIHIIGKINDLLIAANTTVAAQLIEISLHLPGQICRQTNHRSAKI
jgi:hypothetical protein